MDSVNGKHYSFFQLVKIYFKQRSRNYQKEPHIRKTNYQDSIYRIIAELGDIVVLLSPMYLWVVMFLLMCSDLIPVFVFRYGNYVIFGLLFLTFIFVQPYLVSITYGQSLGKYICRFKVVGLNGKEVSQKKLYFRELFKVFPVLLLQVLFGFIPTIIYVLLNILLICVDPKHRNLVDFFFQTRVVVLLSGKKKTVVKEVVAPISKNQIDLQLYSDFSYEHSLTIEELFQKAKKQGLRYISITDRNCAKINAIAKRMSELYHVGYITGVEVDCMYKGKEVRLFGYHIDYQKEAFKKIENDFLSAEKAVWKQRVVLFEAYTGIKLPVEELLTRGRLHMITPEIIANYVLNEQKYQELELFQPYLSGKYQKEPYRYFEKEFFGVGKPCYVERKLPDMRVIIEVIHRCGGVVILAEPMWQFDGDLEFVETCINMGIDGIQVFSSLHTNNQMKILMKLAKDEKCLVSSGSGYMGTFRNVEIGDTNCPVQAESILMKLIQK